jgi:hypothetical protein
VIFTLFLETPGSYIFFFFYGTTYGTLLILQMHEQSAIFKEFKQYKFLNNFVMQNIVGKPKKNQLKLKINVKFSLKVLSSEIYQGLKPGSKRSVFIN